MRILFVHNGRERFVYDDLALLRANNTVTDCYLPRPLFNPARLSWQVARHELVFCWFASWHSLLPVLLARALGRPAVVVTGGYDTARVPAAGYGSQRGGLARLVARAVIGSAGVLIANSYTARREAVAQAGANPAKIRVIYHGVTPQPPGPPERAPIVLTVGNLFRENLLRKGLLPFVDAAAYLPAARFVVVGRWPDESIELLRHRAAPNVEFRGFLPDDELGELYSHASVYVQASLHEGFGLSVGEAMSAGCIPVVSRIGALQEVVGDCGLYLDSNDPQVIAATVAAALQLPSAYRERASQRIADRFPLQRRQISLEKLLGRLAR